MPQGTAKINDHKFRISPTRRRFLPYAFRQNRTRLTWPSNPLLYLVASPKKMGKDGTVSWLPVILHSSLYLRKIS